MVGESWHARGGGGRKEGQWLEVERSMVMTKGVTEHMRGK